jgi:hypothetical protein
LAVWQAGVLIPLNAWLALLVVPVYGSIKGLVEALPVGLLRPAQAELLVQGVAVAWWGGFVITLAWNGLIIWFFNRASVKAQFQRAG